jgi:hypothetical protein
MPPLPFGLRRLGVRAKPLPRRTFPREGAAKMRAPASTWRTSEPARVAALGAVLSAIESLPTHADRMHVLAAVAALHDDPDEAAFFLAAGVEDDRGRCGRCGRAAKLSRWRNDP